MDYLFLFLAVLFAATYNILSKIFLKKNNQLKHPEIIFNLVLTLAATIAWGIMFSIFREFEATVILYSLGFGLSYFFFLFFFQKAITSGPFSLTVLFANLGLIATALWGLIFWDVTIDTKIILGLIFASISIALMVIKKPGDKEKKFNLKWFIYALLTLLTNAACSIFQKEAMRRYEGSYKYELMFFALLITFTLSILYFFSKRKEITLKKYTKTSYLSVISGLLIFGLNVMVLLLARVDSSVSSTIVYPTIGVGVIGLCLIFSLAFLKERLTIIQYIGLAFGIAGIILLSLS